jgi:hypothetical protein
MQSSIIRLLAPITISIILFSFIVSFASAQTIPANYFGSHILGPLETNISGSGVSTLWPSWSPTTVRLLNTYGYNSGKGTYDGIAWSSINTANGLYDWTLFDAVLAKLKAKGVTDLLYTIASTPTWAGGGTSHDQAPSNNQYLATFATAVAQRAIADGLPIKYWEVWNEPSNGAGTWTGTNAQMVAMAQTIYNAVKAVDPSYKVLTPSPQGNSTSWMSSYLAAGGGAYADIMAFHGYTSSAPETIISLINNYKNVYATYGQSSKPIWDTEAMDLTTSSPTLQANFLAVYYLLHWNTGVERFYWYAWDGDQGQEWFYNTGINAAGTSNIQIRNWMLGATPGSLSQNGTVYSLHLTNNGQTTLVVWNSAGASSYSTGSYTQYTDLSGVTHSISGGTVSIGKAPILLSGTAAAPTVTLSAFPTSVTSGGSSTLTWSSTNAPSCTASGGWSGAKATSGSQTLTNLTTTATYTLTCTGAGGGTASASATVTVSAPITSTSYVTGQTLGTLRRDFTGRVGFKFTVGATPLTINMLGRWIVSGNTGTHTQRNRSRVWH